MKAILATAALLAASTALASAETVVKKISTASELTAFYTGNTSNASAKTDGGVSLATGDWTQISSGGLWSADYTGLTTYNTAIAVSFWMKSDYDASNLSSYSTSSWDGSSRPDWDYQAIWQSADVTTASSLSFGLACDGSLRLNHENVQGVNSSANLITKDTWYNVGFVFYNGELSIYLDGECVGTAAAKSGSTTIAYNGTNARFAEATKSMSSGAPKWTGGIDELTVWSVTSTADGAAAIKKAYASAIPEPSAFGLLAGIGALAFAISHRRRSRR